MQTYLDNADKELLANKLKQLFALGQDNTNIYNALLQVQDLFNSFDIKINYEAKEIKEVKDILLIQIDHMGDAVLSSAFIRELRCNYPKANIEIIVAKDWAHLMNRCPYVNKVISVDTTNGLNVIDVINFCSNNLWDIQYDLAINLNWEYNSAALLINFFSAAINRIGYPSNTFEMYCSDLYYDREMYKRRRELDKFFYTYMVINPFDMVDEVERKLWILSSMNLKIKSNKTEVWFNDEDADYVKQFINSKKRNIILGLGGRSLNTRYSVGKLALSLVNNKIDNENNCYCVIGPNDTTAKGNVFSEYKMKTDYEEPEGELAQTVDMGVRGFHDVPGEDCSVKAVTDNGLQGFCNIFRRGGDHALPVIDFDAGVFGAGIRLHRLQLGVQEVQVHLKVRIAGGSGNGLP